MEPRFVRWSGGERSRSTVPRSRLRDGDETWRPRDKARFALGKFGTQPSVAAPGVGVLAFAPDEACQMSTGTSIATAHVSGVVALMLESDSSLAVTPTSEKLMP